MENPYRPGAGHQPPFLAGRKAERETFRRLLQQKVITENVIIGGLRGVGKTVLLGDLESVASSQQWLWAGNDLSESASLSEERLATRVLTDLANVLARVFVQAETPPGGMGFMRAAAKPAQRPLSFENLMDIYQEAPGLPSDKLRTALEEVSALLRGSSYRGIVFAYDEAQCLSDHAERDQYPLSMLLETFQHLQKKEGSSCFMLVLCGLPTLSDTITQARTYTERMFQILMLDRLNRADTLAAITTPLAGLKPTLSVPPAIIERIVGLSGGYPYLIQFFCKELIDQMMAEGKRQGAIEFPNDEVLRRLDQGIFAARWGRTSTEQREFLRYVAKLPAGTQEFTADEVVLVSGRELGQGVSSTHATEMLQDLTEGGLVYRTRHGRYAFSIPMTQTLLSRRLAGSEQAQSWAASQPPVGSQPRVGAGSAALAQGCSSAPIAMGFGLAQAASQASRVQNGFNESRDVIDYEEMSRTLAGEDRPPGMPPPLPDFVSPAFVSDARGAQAGTMGSEASSWDFHMMRP